MRRKRTIERVSIVGFGRFGRVLFELLKDDFAVTLYNRHGIKRDGSFTKETKIAGGVQEIYDSEVIFYAVPIEAFASVIKEHKQYFRPHHVLIDVLSVKLHPAHILRRELAGTKTQAILTHPMFGPDSAKNGFAGLPFAMHRFTASKKKYEFWKNFFAAKHLRVVEMTPQKHDKLAATSQGLTHFIGRLLEIYGLEPTPIDSLGTQKLLEVKEQVRHDSWQLFVNLQRYNPYTKHMRRKLGRSYDLLYTKLLPKHAVPGFITYGIQGGRGSFNEEAIREYLNRTKSRNYRIKYLYTAQKVLRALSEGEIDRGQVAIENSVGGVVEESLEAIATYKCRIAEQFSIPISHALMTRPDTKPSDITTIMTHPQVLGQCRKTLAKKYSHLELTSGKGLLIDHAVVAKRLGTKHLPKHIATMGSKVLARLYGLIVVEDNLQDVRNNLTSFLHLERF